MVVTSFFVEDVLVLKFVLWMREYLPNIAMYKPRLFKVQSQQQPGMQTFSMQVEIKDESVLDAWLSETLPLLSEDIRAKFGDGVLLFTTELKEVSLTNR